MSAESVTAATTGMSEGELQTSQRVRQLQVLIEQTRQTAAGATPTAVPASGSAEAQPASFAAALQAASTADAASASGVIGASYQPAVSSAAAGGSGGEYEALIDQAASRNGLDPAVLHGLIEQESGFDPSATSSAGASGLTQLMPGTASSLGVLNPLDPSESIEGGARYLSQLMTQFGGNTADALAAYNAGPGAVEQYGGVPPYAETQSYVAKVLGYAETYRQSQTSINPTGVAA
jgi:soluble lytic murein transglycosylase-like protein